MAKNKRFNSIEELLALREPQPSRLQPVRRSLGEGGTVDKLSTVPKYGSLKNPYRFKKTKKGMGWEVNYSDEEPCQLDLQNKNNK